MLAIILPQMFLPFGPSTRLRIMPTDAQTIQSQFDDLAEKWRSETRFISNVTKRALHPSYQRIIGIGPSAVPLILHEMSEKGPDDWFWALTAITGENPISEESSGNMNAMMEAWLKWGATTGYLNGSPPKTKNVSQILPLPGRSTAM
jgi:hypothetical protein